MTKKKYFSKLQRFILTEAYKSDTHTLFISYISNKWYGSPFPLPGQQASLSGSVSNLKKAGLIDKPQRLTKWIRLTDEGVRVAKELMNE